MRVSKQKVIPWKYPSGCWTDTGVLNIKVIKTYLWYKCSWLKNKNKQTKYCGNAFFSTQYLILSTFLPLLKLYVINVLKFILNGICNICLHVYSYIHVIMILSPVWDSKELPYECNPFLLVILFHSVTQRNEDPVNLLTRWLFSLLRATAIELYLVWAFSNTKLVNTHQTQEK